MLFLLRTITVVGDLGYTYGLGYINPLPITIILEELSSSIKRVIGWDWSLSVGLFWV
jgi:hypothetical protein